MITMNISISWVVFKVSLLMCFTFRSQVAQFQLPGFRLNHNPAFQIG